MLFWQHINAANNGSTSKKKVIKSEEKRKKERMASNLGPAYAYTVVYVKDVAKSVAFYAKAFGYNVRRLDDNRKYVVNLYISSVCFIFK